MYKDLWVETLNHDTNNKINNNKIDNNDNNK